VADTPAEVAGQGILDFFLGRVRIFIEKRLGSHNDSWCTEAALKGRMVNECLLKGIKFPCLRVLQAFDSGDGCSVALHRQNLTGKNRLPSIITVQAPQAPWSQEIFVPVRPRVS